MRRVLQSRTPDRVPRVLRARLAARRRRGVAGRPEGASTDNTTTNATTLGVFRAVVEASVDDAIAAAAAEAPPRLGEAVATLRYGARAVQQLGNGNVRYIF